MDLKELAKSKETAESKLTSLIEKFEEKLSESFVAESNKVKEALTRYTARQAFIVFQAPVQLLISELTKLLTDLESQSRLLQIESISINRIDAGTLGDPHRSIIGDVGLNITLKAGEGE